MSKMNLSVGIKNLKKGTNIWDIEVPQALRDRKKVGIQWFDEAIGGEGMVPSSVMMLTGTPGAGKTTMLLQLANAITKAGHVCLYNTGEESLYQVKMVVERLGLKDGFIVGQDTLVEDLLSHADNIKRANPNKQLFLLQDSLQTLDDGKYGGASTNSMTPVRCVEMLTDWAKKTYNIAAFIGQVTKDGEFAGKQTILHAVDLRGQLYIDSQKRSETFGERIFEITKNRFGCSGKSYILGMERSGLYSKGCFSTT